MGAVRAVNAAVTGLGLEYGMAVPAFIKPLAGVCRHRLCPGVAAFGAGQRGFELDGADTAISVGFADVCWQV